MSRPQARMVQIMEKIQMRTRMNRKSRKQIKVQASKPHTKMSQISKNIKVRMNRKTIYFAKFSCHLSNFSRK